VWRQEAARLKVTRKPSRSAILSVTLGLGFHAAISQNYSSAVPRQFPWADTSLSPDQRADVVVRQMTLDEKLQLVHGSGWGVLRPGSPVPAESNRGPGFVPGVARLGIPKIDLADSAVGVRMVAPESRYATLLPSVLALASTWDTAAANLYGQVLGRELRAQGFNMSIGGVDLTREPRNALTSNMLAKIRCWRGISSDNLRWESSRSM
jgi:beta-glucosidase